MPHLLLIQNRVIPIYRINLNSPSLPDVRSTVTIGLAWAVLIRNLRSSNVTSL